MQDVDEHAERFPQHHRLPVVQTSFKSSITAATAACFSFKPYEQFANKMTKARLHLIGTLHPMLSYKAENYNVSIAQPWAGCSHFLPHMDLPAAPSRHVNRTHMEKTKTGFITVFSYCGNTFWHFCNLTKLDHTVWWPERHNSSEKFEEWNLHWRLLCWKTDLSFKVFFYLFSFFCLQRGPVNHVLYTSGRGFTASPQGGRRAWWEKHDGISL